MKKRIYDYQMALAKKPDFTFEQFIELFLNVRNRPELDITNVSLNVSLDCQSEFNEMVLKHIHAGENIAIIGDYDVDGICASAIMAKTLALFIGNEKVKTFIPNRFKDGYGMNKRLVDDAILCGCNLIITVDNGIKANEAIDYAISKGMEVIITDHHTPEMDNLPKANLTINPHIGNSHLSTQDICGAMVAFFLSRQLLSSQNLVNGKILDELAELAAIATICDVMPLIGENRKIVKYLLNLMHRNEDVNKGISALINVCKTGRFAFNVESVSYSLGPCLNAPGRLDSALTSYNLLMEDSFKEINKLANIVDAYNNDRKQLTVDLKKASLPQLDNNSVNVIYLEKCSEGIVGIIAGKICEDTNLPTFVFTDTPHGTLKGSGRSPKWCNLIENATEVLNSMKDDVLGFGGHAGAMGLSLKDKTSLDLFKAKMIKKVGTLNRIEEEIKAIRFPQGMDLKSVKDILDRYEPFGEGFEEPLFVCKTPINYLSAMGESHCRFSGFLNNEKVYFYFFFTNLDPEYYEGKMVNCYFNIHKDVAETTGNTVYSLYVKFIEEV